jgi:hypothetical protein
LEATGSAQGLPTVVGAARQPAKRHAATGIIPEAEKRRRESVRVFLIDVAEAPNANDMGRPRKALKELFRSSASFGFSAEVPK